MSAPDRDLSLDEVGAGFPVAGFGRLDVGESVAGSSILYLAGRWLPQASQQRYVIVLTSVQMLQGHVGGEGEARLRGFGGSDAVGGDSGRFLDADAACASSCLTVVNGLCATCGKLGAGLVCVGAGGAGGVKGELV